uniref:AB hydrolase-1 domain-containing protein n=1 Tax=Caenorhabditis japonica TaxID=281687 RepID=A0A8R1IFH7_CAEJA
MSGPSSISPRSKVTEFTTSTITPRPHVGKTTKSLLETFSWTVLANPPYSQDLAPTDYTWSRTCNDSLKEIVEFEDGGAAGIDWLIPAGADENSPIVIFLPGITGSTYDSSYVLHPVKEARDKGWRCLVVNPRGLGGVKLRTTKTYNAATPNDFADIVKLLNNRYPKAKKLACGFSMGGMILWNYLAMTGEKSDLNGGMIVSSPWDPMVASDSIEAPEWAQ